MKGMIEGFFGFEIFDFGIFWEGKCWQVFFFPDFSRFLEIFDMGLNFGPGIFWGFV